MDRRTGGDGRRVRVARSLDDAHLRWLAGTVTPGSGACVELVQADGRRLRIARGASDADLRALFTAAGTDEESWVELHFTGSQSH